MEISKKKNIFKRKTGKKELLLLIGFMSIEIFPFPGGKRAQFGPCVWLESRVKRNNCPHRPLVYNTTRSQTHLGVLAGIPNPTITPAEINLKKK